MAKFHNRLKVMFFIGNEPILYDEKFSEYNKMSKDNSIYLDLESMADVKILDILLKSNKVELQGKVYTIVEFHFMIDGTALYVTVSK